MKGHSGTMIWGVLFPLLTALIATIFGGVILVDLLF